MNEMKDMELMKYSYHNIAMMTFYHILSIIFYCIMFAIYYN